MIFIRLWFVLCKQWVITCTNPHTVITYHGFPLFLYSNAALTLNTTVLCGVHRWPQHLGGRNAAEIKQLAAYCVLRMAHVMRFQSLWFARRDHIMRFTTSQVLDGTDFPYQHSRNAYMYFHPSLVPRPSRENWRLGTRLLPPIVILQTFPVCTHAAVAFPYISLTYASHVSVFVCTWHRVSLYNYKYSMFTCMNGCRQVSFTREHE